MRRQSKRSNHRYRMKEEDDVASKRVGGAPVKADLEVRPKKLAGQPGNASDCEKEPERTRPSLGIGRVCQQSTAGKRRDEALEDIPKGGKPRTGTGRQGNCDVRPDEQHPSSPYRADR